MADEPSATLRHLLSEVNALVDATTFPFDLPGVAEAVALRERLSTRIATHLLPRVGIENAPADGKYPAGTVAMARTSDPNSNADQFFITYKDTTLPVDGGGYWIFVKVTGGMDIVNRIAAAGVSPVDQMTPMAPISILSVAVQAKG